MSGVFHVAQHLIPRTESLGLCLDRSTHQITYVNPGSVAQAHGVTVGGVLVAVDTTTVTEFEYAPGPMEGTLVVNFDSVTATADASMLISSATSDHLTLHILTQLTQADMPQTTVPSAGPPTSNPTAPPTQASTRPKPSTATAHDPFGGAARASLEQGRLPTIKGQARQPLQQQAPQQAPHRPSQQDTAMALAHYPWATKFQDADGHMKNRYNMPDGAVLQPMQSVQGSGAVDAIKRKEAYAATMRPGTSGYAFDR